MKKYLLLAAILIARAAFAQTYDVEIRMDIPYQDVENSTTYMVFDDWDANTSLTGLTDGLTVTSFSQEYNLQQGSVLGIHPRGFVALQNQVDGYGMAADAFYVPNYSGENSSITYSKVLDGSDVWLVVQYKNAFIANLFAGDDSYMNYQFWLKASDGSLTIHVGDCEISEAAKTVNSQTIFGYFDAEDNFATIKETMFLTGSLENPSINRTTPFAPFGHYPPDNTQIIFHPVIDTGVEEEMTQSIWDELKYSPSKPLGIYDTMGNLLGSDIQEAMNGRPAGSLYIIRYGDKVYKVQR